jgi:hypothetical protein
VRKASSGYSPGVVRDGNITMQPAPAKSSAASSIKGILLAWIIAGTMDITAASIQYYLRTGKGPGAVLRFVASGALGKTALKGGSGIELAGLGFHYLVALIFTLIFFIVFPLIPVARKSLVITGLIYGMLVWVIMNRLVLPLSAAPAIPFVLKKAAIAMGILMLCIGLPISIIIGAYYRRRQAVYAV